MTRWWRRPWIVPLAAIVVIFVAFSIPPYLSFDPARSRVPQPPSLGVAHFWLLVPHVLFGSVALGTAVFQIWPWFRQRYPVAHRRIGRLYVFGGVLPGGLCALTIGAFTPFGPVTRASDVLLALLWLGTTVAGWRAARRRRFGEHRRWMIRSFALTASIISNRIWGAIFAIALLPRLDTTFHGDERLLSWVVSAGAAWLGWTIPLLVAEWWLDRDRTRGRRRDRGQDRRRVPGADAEHAAAGSGAPVA
ncbi:hypothetical protein GCM10010168_86590 [Actinoplanes ianthinogenes]|uniref:Membrane protein DUF2306 n=1 Tax=Actinoplanes ianthinogenes TaxID=122358 RepID=A0ABN6CK57_9ACTN|nr:DUF2306 domain-containing protein [Actinoplanes ianthinogenes]BCJ45390.1 hypothetical protein Aiant_60470 [Actinoplanes ianthinogenes]GGR54157.1 hypothetical protein GCM10010168_86590 [Actinoplanes ianthinogenes]